MPYRNSHISFKGNGKWINNNNDNSNINNNNYNKTDNITFLAVNIISYMLFWEGGTAFLVPRGMLLVPMHTVIWAKKLAFKKQIKEKLEIQVDSLREENGILKSQLSEEENVKNIFKKN